MVVPLASRHARVHLVAPVDHVSSDWAEGSADTHVGSIHLVKEYFTGMPAADLAIQFRDAAEFFGAEAYRARAQRRHLSSRLRPRRHGRDAATPAHRRSAGRPPAAHRP